MKDENENYILKSYKPENYAEKISEMNKNRRILLVDDEPYNILGLTIIL